MRTDPATAQGTPTTGARAAAIAELRAAGFHLIPLHANDKRPKASAWQASYRTAWRTIRDADNVGIFTGAFRDGAILALDIDTKAGKTGNASLEMLQDLHGRLPTTRVHATPSGGRHLIFKVREAVPSPVEKLGSGLDVRSAGAQIAAPPSTIDGKAYTVESAAPIADAPQWLIDLCGQRREREQSAVTPLPGTDEKRARVRAIEYLQTEAPEAVEGQGGDATAYKVAAHVKDLGCSEAEALALMLDHWNDRCQPPWNADELADKVRNAYAYGQNRQGSDDPAAVFGAAPASIGPEAADIGTAPRVQIVDAASVQSVPIGWLWPGWLARGKLHVIAGAPGTGKTTLALGWAGSVSAGRAFPDGAKAKPGRVLIWSGEDGFEDTLRPRLAAAGADLDRVHFVGDVQRNGQLEPFDPAKHVPALARALAELGDVALVIVDPLVSAVSGDSHKNAEVRRGLAPLVDLAAKLDAALVGITHYSKGTQGREPLERVSGSLAFGALARLVFGTVRENVEGDDGARRYMLLRVKSNIGPDGGGFAYTIEQCRAEAGIDASRVVWGDAIHGNARELLGKAEAVGDRDSAGSDAATFLREVLAGGPMPAGEVKKLAAAEGHAWRTVQRASTRAAVRINRSGSGAGHVAMWSLAPNEYQSPGEPFPAG